MLIVHTDGPLGPACAQLSFHHLCHEVDSEVCESSSESSSERSSEKGDESGDESGGEREGDSCTRGACAALALFAGEVAANTRRVGAAEGSRRVEARFQEATIKSSPLFVEAERSR